MDAPLEAQLQQLQKQSVAHAIHFIANQSEVYYEAVRRAAHLASARPEMFLLRAVFALDLTRIAIPRGGAIPLASLPNAATEHPKLRRAVPQAFAGLEPSFQETLQRLVSSIDINRQFVVWLTVEGEGLATHDLGRSVHAGVVIDALDRRPTWVGHLGGRTASGGDNLVPPHKFHATADGRVIPEAGTPNQHHSRMLTSQQQLQHQQHHYQQQQQQQQQSSMLSPQQKAQLAQMQQRFGPQVSAIPAGALHHQQSPSAQQFLMQQQQPQYHNHHHHQDPAPGGGSGNGSGAWGMMAGGGATPPQSALSGMSGGTISSPSALSSAVVLGAGPESPSTSLFASPHSADRRAAGGALKSTTGTSPPPPPSASTSAPGIMASFGSTSTAKARASGNAAAGHAAHAGGGANQISGFDLDRIDEILSVSHMCTKASTKCIEQLGSFNVRLDELHNYTSSLQDRFDSSRAEARALNAAVEGLMAKVLSAEKNMLVLQSPKPVVRQAPAEPNHKECQTGDVIIISEEEVKTRKEAAARKIVKHSALAECPYCDTPFTKFCHESGRRHETPEEKAERRWKHLFRQMAMMSSFVSNVRLSKKNTMVEEASVELLL